MAEKLSPLRAIAPLAAIVFLGFLTIGLPLPALPRQVHDVLGFGPVVDAWLNLSPVGDLKEAAANLFAMLRDMDEQVAAIAVSPIPMTGLGEAINDRLARAAAPR